MRMGNLTTGIALALTVLLGSATARAATITVNTTADELNSDGDCSLREAVRAANTGAAVDACPAGSGTDVIQLAAGTYTLSRAGDDDTATLGDLDVTRTLTVRGAGRATTTVDPNRIDRAFHVVTGALTVEDLSIVNGQVPFTNTEVGGEEGPAHAAGAILARAPLTLTRVDIRNCAAADVPAGKEGSGGIGGALAADAPITLTDVKFIGNRAGNARTAGGTAYTEGGMGGAIYSDASLTIDGALFEDNAAGKSAGAVQAPHGGAIIHAGSLVVRNTLFKNNRAGTDAAGAFGGGGAIMSDGEADISATTFVGNRAAQGAAIFQSVGAVHHDEGVTPVVALHLRLCTVTGNVVEGGAGAAIATKDSDAFLDHVTLEGSGRVAEAIDGWIMVHGSLLAGTCGSHVDSLGANVVTDASCLFSGQDLRVTDARLAPLGEYGGTVPTRLLRADSPAIDAGACVDGEGSPVSTDQRGQPRRVGSGCDAGAVELGAIQQLLTMTAVEAGSTCATGGTLISMGIDDDGDGTLDAEEIDQRATICNGATGTTGAAALVKLTPIAAGTTDCNGVGGTRVDAGVDDDHDGVLDEGEIDSTRLVCNGTAGDDGETGDDGATTLVRVTAVTAGGECAAGGQRIMAGLDDDRDGVLEDGEIDSTTLVCNGSDGEDGEAGTPGNAGTPGTNGTNGDDGAAGRDGRDGRDGADGRSCTVTQDADGNATISCPDGTTAKVAASGGCASAGAGAFALVALLGRLRRRRRG